MVTHAKTTGTREMSPHTLRDNVTTRQGKEFDVDEHHDENEFDAEDRRNNNEGQPGGERTPARTPSRRGFAAMDKEKQKMIASKGGKASHGGGRKPSKNR